jgi:4-amino-4-deoxy-L-arabinose transferase-like glycosyltransferase
MRFWPLSRAGALGLLLLLYVASVAVRLPNLHRPLSGFGFSTAHTLIVLENFAAHGPAHFHFLPVVSYQNPGDRGVPWAGFKMQLGADGNYYHCSYPVLSYTLEHYIFKACGVFPSVAAIENLNLALCALSALLIFLILDRALRDRPAGRGCALLGAGLYLFTPSTLIFQANTFFVDMMMQPLFIGCIFCGQRLFEAPERTRWWLLTGVMIFVTSLTEWIGFLTLAVVLVLAWWALPWRRYWRGLLGLCGAATLSLAITVFLAAQISSPGEALGYFIGKYTTYSGVHSNERSHLFANLVLFRRFYFWMAGPIIFAVVAPAALLVLSRMPFREWMQRADLRLCVLAGGPVAIHVVVLFAFNSHHDYATLKALPCFAFLAAFLTQRLLSIERNQRRLVVFEAALAAAVIASSLFIYHRLWSVDDRAASVTGAQLAHAAEPAQVLALESPFEAMNPRVPYAARRNIYAYHGDDDLREHLRQQHLHEAVIVSIDGDYHITGSRRFVLP